METARSSQTTRWNLYSPSENVSDQCCGVVLCMESLLASLRNEADMENP